MPPRGEARGRVTTALRHGWDYAWGRVPVETSLRYSFAVGVAATTVVTLLTYLAVERWGATEANPLMWWVIDTYGWVAFGVVRYAVVVGIFLFIRPFASVGGHWREWSEGNGRLAAAVLSLNAVRDAFVVATGVVPTFALLRLLGVG